MVRYGGDPCTILSCHQALSSEPSQLLLAMVDDICADVAMVPCLISQCGLRNLSDYLPACNAKPSSRFQRGQNRHQRAAFQKGSITSTPMSPLIIFDSDEEISHTGGWNPGKPTAMFSASTIFPANA